MFATGLSGTAHGQSPLQLLQLETVNYGALSSIGNIDGPSIAVRDDGLVRIAIVDFQGTCCPLVTPLKVATRGATGGWTHLTISNHGAHLVPHFLSSGELGVLYLDFGDQSTIKFARVGDTSVQIERVFQLGLNPGVLLRLTPWEIESTNDIQAVVLLELRLRRTATGWSSATFSGTPQDVAIGPVGEVLILASQGLLTFASSELSEPGMLTPVAGGVPSGGNLIVDGMGRIHIAYSLDAIPGGNVRYGLLQSGIWNFETVARDTRGLFNDQSLLVDTSGQPHLIYQNSGGQIVVASKTATGWVEVVDLGPGIHGSMVLGPFGDIHATFTSTSDKLVRYARLQTSGVLDGGNLSPISDSFLRKGRKNLNEGANHVLMVGKKARAVVAFNLPEVLPAELTKATLVLTIAEPATNWGKGGRLVNAHRLLEPFTEGNGFVFGQKGQERDRGSGEGVTWNCPTDVEISNKQANCDVLWLGGSMAAGPATDSVLHTNGLIGEVAWDVTLDVLAGLEENAANIQWLIRKAAENQKGEVLYFSREGAAAMGDSKNAPRLILKFR